MKRQRNIDETLQEGISMGQKRRLTKKSARLQQKEGVTRSCSDCTHAMLDPLFGDYKCLQRVCYVYDMGLANKCEAYKEDKKDAEM